MTAVSGTPLARRRRLGWTELLVSPLALGTMQFGWSVTDVGAFDILDRYRQAGGNFIDTADMYGPDQTRRSWAAARPHVGVTEDVIGRWLADRGCRDEMVVATKVRAQMWSGPDGAGLSPRHVERAVEDSLRRLNIETIDLYQAHWPDDTVPLEETWAAFEQLVDAGKVRYVGTSNYAMGGAIAEVAELWRHGPYPRLASEQPRYSLLHRDEYEDDIMPVAVRDNVGVICYSPLAAGFLTGKFSSGSDLAASARGAFLAQYDTPAGWQLVRALRDVGSAQGASCAAVALAWLLQRPGITCPVAGANSVAQLDDWMTAAELELTPEETEALDAASWKSSAIEFSSW